MILDGALILTAYILLTIQNPGQVLGHAWPDTAYSWGSSRKGGNSQAFELRSGNRETSDLKAGEAKTVV